MIKSIFPRLTSFFKPLKPDNDPEVTRKNDLTILLAFNLALFGLMMFTTRYLIEGSSASKTIWLLPIISAICILSLLFIKYLNNSKISTYIILSMGLVVIFLRSASTGGAHSPVAIWLTLAPVVAILLLPLRQSLFWLALTVAALFLLSFPHLTNMPIVQKESSQAIQFIVLAIFVLVFSFVIILYERERVRNEKRIEDSEKKLASTKRLIALGNISGGLAHEINNPLAIIKGNADLLKLKTQKENLDSELISISHELDASILRIQGIVDSMRSFTKDDFFMTGGQVQLKSLVENVFQQRSDKLEKYGIKYSLDFHSEVTVNGNREAIMRVLINLIDNSIDATIGEPSPWIRVKVDGLDRIIQMTFTDSGRGVAKDIEPHIMEPFFTSKPIGTAVGLGLTICHNLMKIQGGDIVYDSSAPHTTFVLTFQKA